MFSILDLPDDVIEERLLGLVRASGIKFQSRQAFQAAGWPGAPDPVIARHWSIGHGRVQPSPHPLLWDLREPLLQDLALMLCCVLLHRRAARYGVRWIGGLETAAIPIVAGMLAVNRAMGGPPMNGFYLRKKRKRDGLRRLLEGPRPPRGERVLLVDDILNKGLTKQPLIDYCRHNDLVAAAMLVVVDTERGGRALFAPICPVEALFTRCDVLSPCERLSHASPLGLVDTATGAAPMTRLRPEARSRADLSVAQPGRSPAEMSREDVELVRLARDTVICTALTGGKLRPTIGKDQRGSPGYSPFLGRYLSENGVVFTRISKREFKDGHWFNRIRGCQAVGLMNADPRTFAEMTVNSAVISASRARKVKSGPAVFHKPVWPGEVGALSLFVYVVEQLAPTHATTADELAEEAHNVLDWGLIAERDGLRGVICGDLPGITDIPAQIAAACRKMQDDDRIEPQDPSQVTFTRMKGRWLWDPSRPKSEFF